MTSGKTLFDAYSMAVGGITYDKKPIPEWDQLGDPVRAGWNAAAIIANNFEGIDGRDLSKETIREIILLAQAKTML